MIEDIIYLFDKGGVVMYPLSLCSVWSIYIIIDRLWYIRSIKDDTEPNQPLYDSMYFNMSILSSMVTISPIIGLLGTVIAMIKVFNVFNIESNIVTNNIGEALIATATGLTVSIISMVGYMIIKCMIENKMLKLEKNYDKKK